MAEHISSEGAKDLLAKAIQTMENDVEYADALYERAEGVSIVKDNVEERVSTPVATRGLVLRVYRLGQWREASTHDLSPARAVELAKKLASFEPLSRNSVKLQELKPWELDEELSVKINPSEVDVEEKLEPLRGFHRDVIGRDKRIVNARVAYSDLISEKDLCQH
jgi:predicted Zn-dependent protease